MRTEEEIRSKLEEIKREYQALGYALSQPQSPLNDINLREKRAAAYQRKSELHWVLGEDIPGWDAN